MRLPARVVVLTFAAVLALGGCGGQSGGGMSSAARDQLLPLVQQVRRAAESRDVQGARRALTELQRAVASHADRGEISPARAAQILGAAALVQRRLGLVPISTTTTTTTPAPPEGGGQGNKDKHGKGNGDNGRGGND